MKNLNRAKAQINLSALKNNAQQIQQHIGCDTQIIAVIKAEGYGHGMIKTAQTLFDAGIKMFGVAIIDEAIDLREAGIKSRILIMGAGFESTNADFINHDCEQTVYSYAMAKSINSAAKKLNKIASIQIKIDTGMNRLGFLPTKKSILEIETIFDMPNIKVTGIFSHLASSSSSDKSYTYMQHMRFKSMIDSLKAKGINIPHLHISNSGAVLNHPHLNYDAVRPGIILYGIYPDKNINKTSLKLEPVMSLKSVVSFIKTIKKGECVSYDAAFKAKKPTVVVTVPIGYADGFRKGLGNGRGRVLINGVFCPVIGQVCMDQFMVDASDCGAVKIEDEVVIIGRQGDNSICLEELSDAAKTIPYEIMCGFSNRVPREFV